MNPLNEYELLMHQMPHKLSVLALKCPSKSQCCLRTINIYFILTKPITK